MKKRNFIIKENIRLGLLLVFSIVLTIGTTWADGSKDLYPSGKTGRRAYLYTGPATSNNTTPAYPFKNNGVHYVYAKVGETITLASSAQGSGSARINLYAPNGDRVVNDSQKGNIPNRAAELAGPKLPNGSGGPNTYTPDSYLVPAGGEGIYRVHFTSRGTSDPTTSLDANANWNQGDIGIYAWDVSVANTSKTGFVPGRVYANVLNLSNGYTAPNTTGFYGLIYVLTKDGYTYRVNNNGNNGMYFTFFVNNNGFIDNKGLPIYKSLSSSTPSSLTGKVQNPNLPDTETQITHKLFYALPASDLPINADVSYASASKQKTWLKNKIVKPEVLDVKLIGVEGVEGQVSNKGGYVSFTADAQGQYSIEIESAQTPTTFTKRTLTGSSQAGLNRILWDGKDGSGNKMPPGNVPAKLTVKLQGAEVHFPFIDMEYNTKGIIIELLNHEKLNQISPVIESISDIVYWNDIDISNSNNGTNAPRGRYSDPKNNSHLPAPVGIASQGISSNSNGHIWGQGASGTGGQFGDEKSMDTWTFITGETVTKDFDVEVKIADLYTDIKYKINGVDAAKSASVDNTVEYTVTAGSKGPSDIKGAKFAFSVPVGVDITNLDNITFTTSCGGGTVVQAEALTYNSSTRSFTSKLNLPANCSITYTFTGKLSGSLGLKTAESTILRPNDVYDPDATNGDINTPPTNPHYECFNNADGGDVTGSTGCNNIQEVTFMLVQDCTEEYLYYEDFSRGFWSVNDGRTDWRTKKAISLGLNTGLPAYSNGVIERNGQTGGATSSYLFAPGQNDSRYASANSSHSPSISVARIKNGYYSVNPPGYVQMGIPTIDSWHEGLWVPNAPTNDPDVANSNYDWTPAWSKPNTIRDVSGAVNGAAFLVRGATSASQSIKPFYEFNVATPIVDGQTYTLSMYSYVTYHDKDYMIMDVIDQESGHIYASVPLKYPGQGLPPNATPEGFSLGWVPLQASVKFNSQGCETAIAGKKIKIAIRGSQDRSLETGKGFGHTLIDDISFTKRTVGGDCEIPATEVTCEESCYLDIEGRGYRWNEGNGNNPGTGQVERTFTQPATNGGFKMDIYYLDNSLNMEVNGVKLYKDELQFQKGPQNFTQNVRFKSDGKKWEENGIPDIWKLNEGVNIDFNNIYSNPTPAIRVSIDKWGNVTLYGKRKQDGDLEELEVFNPSDNKAIDLDPVHWVTESSEATPNTVKVTQKIAYITAMTVYGYGQNQKECETCTISKEGVFTDENTNGFAHVGETITYTFEVKNAGDMDIHDVEIADPLFGFTIKLDENTHLPTQEGVTFSGDNNINGILNRSETWTFTVKYKITSEDIFTTKGVYNRAEVKGLGKLPSSDRIIEGVLSTDPTPYLDGDTGWDPNRPFHTYVPLKGGGLLISNPMIYQRMK